MHIVRRYPQAFPQQARMVLPLADIKNIFLDIGRQHKQRFRTPANAQAFPLANGVEMRPGMFADSPCVQKIKNLPRFKSLAGFFCSAAAAIF
jgi:hypothetical protein